MKCVQAEQAKTINNNKHRNYFMLMVCCSWIYVFVVVGDVGAAVCFRRILMYNWHTSIICCSVGLGMYF